MRAAAALAIVALLPTPAAHALCAQPLASLAVLNENLAVPADGGLVVAMTYSGRGDRDDEAAMSRDWSYKTDKDKVKAKRTVLAPGLALYTLPAGVAAADLFDGTFARGHVTSMTTTAGAVLAAPKIKSIKYTVTPGRRGNTTSTMVALDGDPPSDAIALIVYGAKGVPRSFSTLQGDASINVYYQGRCSALPNGTIETKAGDRVTLRWVDKLGRLSAPTKPIKVTKG